MDAFELAIVKSIFAQEVRQGHSHTANIKHLYTLIRNACEKEFTEDNAPTLDAFLREQFEATQSYVVKTGD